MAENRLPRANHKLLAHADHQTRACANWQDTLGLVHVRAGRLGPAARAARAAETELRAAHARWSAARSERRRLDHETWDFIALARVCLVPAFGRKWSPEWQLVGFTRHSLRVPERFADREQLLESLAGVLEAHPDWEHPKSGLTAPTVRARYDALTSADANHTSSRTRLRRARRERDTAVAELNRTLRALKKELRLVLDPADPLWLEFNLNPPIRRRKPGAKAGVSTATATAATENGAASRTSEVPEAIATPPRSRRREEADSLDNEEIRLHPSVATARREGFSTATPRPADAEEPSASAGRRSLWNLLRAGARKITWNLF